MQGHDVSGADPAEQLITNLLKQDIAGGEFLARSKLEVGEFSQTPDDVGNHRENPFARCEPMDVVLSS